MVATLKDGEALPFDAYASGFNEDPYPHYARLLAADPVYWDPLLRAWMLTRMTEVTEVLNDETFHVFNIGKPIAEMARLAGKDFRHLVRAVDAMTFLQNGDDHRAARRALGLAISRVPFRDLEPVIDEMARKLATDLSTRRSFDAARGFRRHPTRPSNDGTFSARPSPTQTCSRISGTISCVRSTSCRCASTKSSIERPRSR